MFSLHGYISPISILNTFFINPSPASDIIQETLFQEILPAFTAGLFLGYMFYKMDWSILGCTIFRIGTLLFFYFTPITANAPWWMGLTFEVMAYVLLIVIVESAIKEPRHRRRRYGLE